MHFPYFMHFPYLGTAFVDTLLLKGGGHPPGSEDEAPRQAAETSEFGPGPQHPAHVPRDGYPLEPA